MNTEFEHIARIEKYENGELSNTEIQAFEADLLSNDKLAKEYADFINIKKGLEIFEEEILMADINSIHKELEAENFFNNATKIKSIMEHKQEKKQRGIGRLLSIAAGLVFLVGASYFFMQSNSPSRAELMAKAEVKPNIELANKIIKNNESLGFADADKGKKDTITLIANYYKEGKYDVAIKIINEYIERYSPDFDINYMLGSCMFQDGQYAKAVKHLQPLLDLETAEEKQEIQWMIALSYLQFNSEVGDSNAKKMLEKLIKDPGSYDPQAIRQYIDMI